MATVSGSSVSTRRGVVKTTWSALTTTNNVGSPENLARAVQATVQVLGTFGVGGSVSIEGSNDGGTTWVTLFDNRGAGAALTFAAAGLKSINDIPERIRPNVTAGDGSTSLTVIINTGFGK